VRESLLGGTLMAWGASAGDLAGMLAVARAGSTRMAITASLAGPLCQLAMGTVGLYMYKLNAVYP
jgi:Ca2+/Na+ antiporter